MGMFDTIWLDKPIVCQDCGEDIIIGVDFINGKYGYQTKELYNDLQNIHKCDIVGRTNVDLPIKIVDDISVYYEHKCDNNYNSYSLILIHGRFVDLIPTHNYKKIQMTLVDIINGGVDYE